MRCLHASSGDFNRNNGYFFVCHWGNPTFRQSCLSLSMNMIFPEVFLRNFGFWGYFHGISMIFPGLDNPNSFEFTRGAQVWRPQERGWDATVAERRGRKQGAEGAPALGGGYKDWEVLGLGYHWVSLGITRYLPWVSCLEILIFW